MGRARLVHGVPPAPYNPAMPAPQDTLPPAPDLQEMERRARSLTGATMGAVALAATYALLLFEDRTTEARAHVYPLIAGVLFYLAGDLIALIWFRLLASQLAGYIRKLEAELRQPPRPAEAAEDDDDIASGRSHAAVDDGVEVIKPGGAR